MNKKIPLFTRLEIETIGACNRTCVTCLRNSIPDKEATASWFSRTLLPTDVIIRLLDECVSLGYKGEVCFSHYSEPLMDDRTVDLCKAARDRGFSRVFFCSNGDFLTEDLAAQLDGVVHEIGFSLYMDEPKRSQRERWIKSLFSKTKLLPFGYGDHMTTHYSPKSDMIPLIRHHKDKPCHHPQRRLIINHKGDMLLCCDDMIGNFGLGNIVGSTVESLWWSDVHQDLVTRLSQPGGRAVHPHCASCPRASLCHDPTYHLQHDHLTKTFVLVHTVPC